jgi:hypothetical protein
MRTTSTFQTCRSLISSGARNLISLLSIVLERQLLSRNQREILYLITASTMSRLLSEAGPSALATDCKPGYLQHIDTQFSASLESSLNSYRSRLTKKEDDEFRSTTLGAVKAEILQIQEQRGKEKKMMNFTRIETFLNAMDEWERVVAGFADTTCFAGFIWGPVKALLQVSSAVYSLHRCCLGARAMF